MFAKKMDTIVVRFAPSPTGHMHIGSARTALFNYLFAKKYNGVFRLRIEDTDSERNNEKCVDTIYESLDLLGIKYDGESVIQSSRINMHKECIKKLLEEGKAYKCFCSKDEIEEMRRDARLNKKSIVYDGRCRNINRNNKTEDYVVRFKVNRPMQLSFYDEILGEIVKDTSYIDDFIIQRSDGTPVYLLSVVVDDHDMGITHVIRGADHILNTFPQMLLFESLGFKLPKFAHIPLINGEDGTKLSKRHGAVSLQDMMSMGMLKEAINNALVRLGFGHGDEEIISLERAKEIFSIKGIGKSSAKFDEKKLLSLNSHYIKTMNNKDLFDRLLEYVNKFSAKDMDMIITSKDKIIRSLDSLKVRCQTLSQLLEMSRIYFNNFISPTISPSIQQDLQLELFVNYVESHRDDFDLRFFCTKNSIEFPDFSKLLRLILTNSKVSPSISEIIYALGIEETINRINKVRYKYK